MELTGTSGPRRWRGSLVLVVMSSLCRAFICVGSGSMVLLEYLIELSSFIFYQVLALVTTLVLKTGNTCAYWSG